MKLLSNPHNDSLNEIFQSNHIQFAFVIPKEKDFVPVHAWCICRDYFNEILFTNYHTDTLHKFSQYGMNYDAKENPINKSEVMLGIKFPSKESKEMFISNIKLLNNVEKWTDISPTKYSEPENDKYSLVLTADKFWQEKTILFNIYTLLLKLCALDIKNKTWINVLNINIKGTRPTEISYINAITPKVFHLLLQNLKDFHAMGSKYVDGTSVETVNVVNIHNYRGILSANSYAIHARCDVGDYVVTYIKILKKQLQKEKDFFLCQEDVKPAMQS